MKQAMIEDLKADSARWESERRAQTSRGTGGAGVSSSRDSGSAIPPRPSSESPSVQYLYSATHQSRQHHGPTQQPYQTDPYDREPSPGTRYPGNGAAGYAAGQYQQPQQPFDQSSGGTFNAGYQHSPQDPRFAGQPPPMGQDLSYMVGANMPPGGYPRPTDGFYGRPIASSAAAPAQPIYATTPPPQPGYTTTAPAYQHPGQPPPTGGGQSTYPVMQSQDPFYGRGASQKKPAESSSTKTPRI